MGTRALSGIQRRGIVTVSRPEVLLSRGHGTVSFSPDHGTECAHLPPTRASPERVSISHFEMRPRGWGVSAPVSVDERPTATVIVHSRQCSPLDLVERWILRGLLEPRCNRGPR